MVLLAHSDSWQPYSPDTTSCIGPCRHLIGQYTNSQSFLKIIWAVEKRRRLAKCLNTIAWAIEAGYGLVPGGKKSVHMHGHSLGLSLNESDKMDGEGGGARWLRGEFTGERSKRGGNLLTLKIVTQADSILCFYHRVWNT